jgi:hypothetical protein
MVYWSFRQDITHVRNIVARFKISNVVPRETKATFDYHHSPEIRVFPLFPERQSGT